MSTATEKVEAGAVQEQNILSERVDGRPESYKYEVHP